eukprot:41161-Pelagomonas_calceolata.AAC.2
MCLTISVGYFVRPTLAASKNRHQLQCLPYPYKLPGQSFCLTLSNMTQKSFGCSAHPFLRFSACPPPPSLHRDYTKYTRALRAYFQLSKRCLHLNCAGTLSHTPEPCMRISSFQRAAP